MKKLVVLVLAGLMVAGIASAQDDGINSLGVYFDAGTYNVHQTTATVGGYVPMNVVMKNADFPALMGYEFALSLSTAPTMFLGELLQGSGAINVGNDPYEYIVGLDAPLATGEATLLATINILAGFGETIITLKGADPNSILGSNGPALLLPADLIIAGGVAAGYDETGMPNPCASINGAEVIVSTDDASWDQVKSLYR